MTDTTVCSECGKPAQLALVNDTVTPWQWRGCCVECWRKGERERFDALFDEADRLASPHRRGCRLCPLTPCELSYRFSTT